MVIEINFAEETGGIMFLEQEWITGNTDQAGKKGIGTGIGNRHT